MNRFTQWKPVVVPTAAWAVFLLKITLPWKLLLAPALAALFVVVMAAVHHAEVISRRIGEPFGALVLALAVTVIEVSIIISLMLTGHAETTFLARDTVFAAVMIILTGMTGLTVFIAGLRFREAEFSSHGVFSVLTILVAISVMALILPNYTEARKGPFYSDGQLFFVSVITLILYGSFLFVQNVRHRDDYVDANDHEAQAKRPGSRETRMSAALLPVSLAAVVALAESMAHDLEHFIESVGAPVALSGIIIACIVLLPEGISAVRVAARNQLQKSLNLSLGSALASISLTIPVISFFALATNRPVAFGIETEASVLFFLSLFVIILALAKGKTNILQGIVLLVLFAVYLFLTLFP
jgi:Ca2+:H+ antiporter